MEITSFDRENVAIRPSHKSKRISANEVIIDNTSLQIPKIWIALEPKKKNTKMAGPIWLT